MEIGEKCQRCGEEGHDRRTLWMACLYEMNELGLPFEQFAVRGEGKALTTDEEVSAFVKENLPPPGNHILNRFYTLRVCKDCRADWLMAIKDWFWNAEPRGSTGTGVWIRDHGTSREATPEEVERMIQERDARKEETQ